MRIFLVGDHYSGTGPSNVTKYYIENLPKGTLYQKRKSKILRVPELFWNIVKSDVAVYSGYSKQNILGMKICRKLHKPTAYIMHGCVEYENEINLVPDKEMAECERQMLELTDRIYAVSKSFSLWLKEHYKEHEKKIDYVTNGVDKSILEKVCADKGVQRDEHVIFSVGGGMPRKKIKHVCKAVELLRESYDEKLRLVVVGDEGADTEEINSYSFVENMGLVTFDKTMELYRKSGAFIQNSCFETFGLAMVEAVAAGCPTVVSNKIGAIEIFSNVNNDRVVERFDDPEEIAGKLRKALESASDADWLDNIDWRAFSWEAATEKLILKLTKLTEDYTY